jgi:hypothetical protein
MFRVLVSKNMTACRIQIFVAVSPLVNIYDGDPAVDTVLVFNLFSVLTRKAPTLAWRRVRHVVYCL